MITTYSYDAVGNRTRLNVDGALTTYAYDAANRLRRSQEVSGITTYTFDANGNQRSIRAPAGEITTYSWTYENQMSGIEEPDGDLTTYTWAPVNRNSVELRIAKETEAAFTKFLWDDQSIIQETDEVGTVEAEYTLQPKAFGELVSQRRGADSSFYAFDALGSAAALTDGAAAVTDEYSFKPFGETRSSSGTTQNPYRWVGKVGYYHDEESGLYSIRRRSYDDANGRWVSEDPLGLRASDTNLYRYVGNDAVNAVDPSGESIGIISTDGWPLSAECFFRLMNYVLQLTDRLGIPIEFDIRTPLVLRPEEVPEGIRGYMKGNLRDPLHDSDRLRRAACAACQAGDEFDCYLLASFLTNYDFSLYCKEHKVIPGSSQITKDGMRLFYSTDFDFDALLGCDAIGPSSQYSSEYLPPPDPSDFGAWYCKQHPALNNGQITDDLVARLTAEGVDDCTAELMAAVLKAATGDEAWYSDICICLLKPLLTRLLFSYFPETRDYEAELDYLIRNLCGSDVDWRPAARDLLHKIIDIFGHSLESDCLALLVDLLLGGPADDPDDIKTLSELLQLIDPTLSPEEAEVLASRLAPLLRSGDLSSLRDEFADDPELSKLIDLLISLQELYGTVEDGEFLAGLAALLQAIESGLRYGKQVLVDGDTVAGDCRCNVFVNLVQGVNAADIDAMIDIASCLSDVTSAIDDASHVDGSDEGAVKEAIENIASSLDECHAAGAAAGIGQVANDPRLISMIVCAYMAYVWLLDDCAREHSITKAPSRNWTAWIQRGCGETANIDFDRPDVTGKTAADTIVHCFTQGRLASRGIHGHHIVPQGLNMRRILSRNILCACGINPFTDCDNLCYSCADREGDKSCHSTHYDRRVLSRLREVYKGDVANCPEVKEELKRLCWAHRNCANGQPGKTTATF